MAYPTAYTYATFRDYLENEVLQGAAQNMGWKDTAALGDITVPVVGSKAASSTTIVLSTPLSETLPSGTKIRTTTFNGTTGLYDRLISAAVAKKGVTKIAVASGSLDSVLRNVNTTVIIPRDVPAISMQAIYDSITNEALLSMGLTTPEAVPAADIKEFRLLGRIEAWRAVVYNTMTDFNVTIGQAQLARSQAFSQALSQLKAAEQEYETLFPFNPPSLGKPRRLTSSGGVTVRF